MNLIKNIRTEILFEHDLRVPVFIFEADVYEMAVVAYGCYHVTPLAINLPVLKNLPMDPVALIPEDKLLRVELAFEDPFPGHTYDVNLDSKQVELLQKANLESERIRFVIEGYSEVTGKIEHYELPSLDPYVLDWKGVLGIMRLIRLSTIEPRRDQLNDMIHGLEMHLAENGYATGIHTELGFLYRVKGELEKSIESYTDEIEYSVSELDFNAGSLYHTFNNMATIYKKLEDRERAFHLFQLALHYNPNYFEALLNMAGVVEFDLSMKCIARAMAIRWDDSIFDSMIGLASKAYGKCEVRIGNRLKEEVSKVDLHRPIEDFVMENPSIMLVN